jgi:hypothetical protein
VQDNPLPLPQAGRAWDGDVDRAPFAGPRKPADMASDPPELGGAQVAEHGAPAASEHRGYPRSVITQSGVADGVNTAMKTVMATGV